MSNLRQDEIIRAVTSVLILNLDPERVYLFGSRAKEKNGKHSDFDFAVSGKKPPLDLERKIDEAVDDVSGLYKVDVVYLGSVEEDFKDIVLKTGKVIYERGK